MTLWQINHAVRVIRQGGVIAYPTEAVYGLGCSPYYFPAVARILKLKRRNISKGLILVGSDISQFDRLADFSKVVDMSPILDSWPGPVTWIIPARRGVPRWLTGDKTGIAIRVSAHPVVGRLCDRAGALVSTSANPARLPPARTAQRVRSYFKNELDFILHAPVGLAREPSQIRDALTGKVLRGAG